MKGANVLSVIASVTTPSTHTQIHTNTVFKHITGVTHRASLKVGRHQTAAPKKDFVLLKNDINTWRCVSHNESSIPELGMHTFPSSVSKYNQIKHNKPQNNICNIRCRRCPRYKSNNFLNKICLRGHFLMRVNSLAYSNLTSQRIMFPKKQHQQHSSANNKVHYTTASSMEELTAIQFKAWREKNMINEGRKTAKQARTHEGRYSSTVVMWLVISR